MDPCSLNSQSEQTAIWRNKLSAPSKWLFENEKLNGRVLDFGCGHGDLQKYLDPKIDQFDPFWTPEVQFIGLLGNYDTVVMNYVLNVLDPALVKPTLSQAAQCLRSGGILFVAVRRDLKKEGPTSRGAQYNVELDLPVVFERKGQFCIYRLEQHT